MSFHYKPRIHTSLTDYASLQTIGIMIAIITITITIVYVMFHRYQGLIFSQSMIAILQNIENKYLNQKNFPQLSLLLITENIYFEIK